MKSLDKIGIALSTACAWHCLLMPFVIVLVPFIGMSFFASEKFEWIIVLASFLIASASLCAGLLKHKKARSIVLAMSGFGLIIWARINHSEHHHALFDKDTLMLFFGGLFIALSHFINNKLCHQCSDCQGA